MSITQSVERIITEARNIDLEADALQKAHDLLAENLVRANKRIAELEAGPVTQPTPDPVPESPPSSSGFKVINPVTQWQSVRSANDLSIKFQPGDYTLEASMQILGDRLLVDGNGARTFANGDIKTHFGVGSSSDGAKISNVTLDSSDAGGVWPFGVMLGGSNTRISNVQGDRVHNFFDILESSRNTTIVNCRNSWDGSIWYYFAYAKGRNVTIQKCTAHRPLSGFLRSNECVGLNIIDCESFGGTAAGAVHDRTGRVLLQSVSDVVIENLKIHRSFLGTGPLWGIDGWNQRKSDEDFFSRRTRNVKIDGLLIDGGGWLEIGYGSENIRITTAGPIPVWFPKPKDTMPAEVLAKLTPPKDIWINGAKVA